MHKEDAIEKYKALLKAMQEEVKTGYAKVPEPVHLENGERKKLKTADEILANVGSSEKDLEIIKLKGDIAHLEAANRRLFEDAEKYRKDAKKCHKEVRESADVGVQTTKLSASHLSNNVDVKKSSEFSLESSEEEDVRDERVPQKRATKVQRPGSAKIRNISREYMRQEALEEALRSEESKSALKTMEIRKLKERIRSLTKANKVRKFCWYLQIVYRDRALSRL